MEPLIDAVLISSFNSHNKAVQVYDLATASNLKSYNGIPANSNSLCNVGAADFIISGQKDKPFLHAWALHHSDPLQKRLSLPGHVGPMAVNQKGPKYCVVAIKEKLYVYKLLTGQLLAVIRRHYQPVTCVKFTHCGNYFASGGEDGFIYMWSMASIINAFHKQDMPQVEPHMLLGQHSEKVTGIAITAAGMRGLIISSSLDQTSKVIDLLTGQVRHTILTSHKLMSVATNTLGSQIFLGGSNGRVWVVHLLPQPPVGNIEIDSEGMECHENAVRHLAVTSLGNQLVTGGVDGAAKVWVVIKGPIHSLALQRTLQVGKGAISNILIMRVNRQIFEFTNLPTYEIISSFKSEDSAKAEETPMVIPIKGDRSKKIEELEALFTHGLDVVIPSRDVIMEDINGNAAEENSDDIVHLHSKIQKLEKRNSELYKFVLQNVVED